jgi:hypothetical protein
MIFYFYLTFFIIHELPQSDGKCQSEVEWQAGRDT